MSNRSALISENIVQTLKFLWLHHKYASVFPWAFEQSVIRTDGQVLGYIIAFPFPFLLIPYWYIIVYRPSVYWHSTRMHALCHLCMLNLLVQGTLHLDKSSFNDSLQLRQKHFNRSTQTHVARKTSKGNVGHFCHCSVKQLSALLKGTVQCRTF